MFSEKDMEDAICADPTKYLGESGLRLVARQYKIGCYIFDLLFEDRHGAKLIVEIQKGTLDRNHTYKILDYYDEYKENNPESFIDLMVIANKIPYERRKRLDSAGICWKEISLSEFQEQITNGNDNITPKTLETSPPTPAAPKPPTYNKELLRNFIYSLCQKTKVKTKLFDRSTCITKNPWIAASMGKHVVLGYDFREGKPRVTLCINFPDLNKTKSIYDLLYRDYDDIQSEIGYELNWQRRDDREESYYENI
jgi:hypothetical protein